MSFQCVRSCVYNLRDLVKEGFPLHDDNIGDLLDYIEDHEQDIIDIVMFAVGNAR